MGYTLINTILVKNISTQDIPINIKKKTDSPITTKYGDIHLQPGMSIEAEDNRWDISQLRSMANNKVIEYSKQRKAYSIGGGTSGSSGA